MRSPRFATVLLLLALLTVAGSAWAGGPLDGSYNVTIDDPMGPINLFLVVLQNGLNGVPFGMALLDGEFVVWTYGFGNLSPDNRVSGPILFYSTEGSDEVGQFDLKFDGLGNVTGTVIYFGDSPLPLSGVKFF